MIYITYEWIGKYIRFHREKKRLTRKQLSELSRVEPVNITSAELRNNGLSLINIIALLNALELDFNSCYNVSNQKIILSQEIHKKIFSCSLLTNDDFLLLAEIIKSLNELS